MVRSIVIPHDQARPDHVCELADLGAFQAAVDGSLEPHETRADERDTYACFDNLFDAATWRTLFRATMARASYFRLASDTELFNQRSLGGAWSW
ncbi:MAG: hypothetical protein R2732_02385 [Microbacteriaceae bacterium]|jgi:hypothetical protein